MVACRHDPVAIQESSSVPSTEGKRQPLRVNPFTGYVLLDTPILSKFRNLAT